MRTFLLAAALTAAPLAAQTLDTDVVLTGLGSPIYLTAPEGDARLFIVDQGGEIQIYKDGDLLTTPFLDVDPLTNGGGEQGLLGLAFHPDYANNGRFFINYTNTSGNTRVVEYAVSAADPDVADPTPVQTIFSVNQPFSNHNGGCLQFGPDGMLYIGLGDGGAANDPGNRSQNTTNNLGKMLRLDIDLPAPFIPADNPFVGVSGTNDEIWALGLRNPWRYSFDRATGDLWIADVGQNAREEVNFQPASSTGGENYGWRCMEGLNCTGLSGCVCNSASLTLPIQQYNTGANCSITGGYVYRGSNIAGLDGTYFYADFCSGRIWSLRYDGNTVTEFTERTAELDPPGNPFIGNISSFGQDGFGELYIVDISGKIFKIVQDCPATNYCQTSPNSVGSGMVMGFNGSRSVTTNDFRLRALGGPAGQPGIFFYGANQVSVAFGDGNRCVGGQLFRLNPPVTIGSNNNIVRTLDFDDAPANAGPGMIVPGSSWNFQFWYRDPGFGTSGFNLSDGLNLVFCP